MKTLHLLFISTVFFILPCRVFALDGITLKSWTMIRTQYTVVQYQSNQDLLAFHRHVRFGKPGWNDFADISSQQALEQLQEAVKHKTDAVFKKAREILDMKKPFPRSGSTCIRINSTWAGYLKKSTTSPAAAGPGTALKPIPST